MRAVRYARGRRQGPEQPRIGPCASCALSTLARQRQPRSNSSSLPVGADHQSRTRNSDIPAGSRREWGFNNSHSSWPRGASALVAYICVTPQRGACPRGGPAPVGSGRRNVGNGRDRRSPHAGLGWARRSAVVPRPLAPCGAATAALRDAQARRGRAGTRVIASPTLLRSGPCFSDGASPGRERTSRVHPRAGRGQRVRLVGCLRACPPLLPP